MKEKKLIDRNGNKIEKGSIVRIGTGWAQVSAVFSNHVNLCGIFSDKITDKHVSILDIYEDREAWYANWQKSETYQSM